MSTTPEPHLAKQRLRRAMKERLATVSKEEARAAAERVARRVMALELLGRPRNILSCYSFGHEVDTRRLVGRLLERGHRLFLPRVAPPGSGDTERRLHVHPFPCPLERHPFGLEQPAADTPELPAEEIDGTLDLVLVLGLAFDRRGYRLGYGGGYFDRFLHRHPLPAVGLGYRFQLVDTLPVDSHDLPMRLVLTD